MLQPALGLFSGGHGTGGFVLPVRIPELSLRVSLHAGEHRLDVPFVMMEGGEGGSEPVVQAPDDPPEVPGHLLESSEDVGVAVAFDGLVEGEVVPEGLLDGDWVSYGKGKHGVFWPSY